MRVTTNSDPDADFKFTAVQTFEVPRELMFRVWTEAEHLMHWFGPKGFPMFACTNDLHPGGRLHYGLRSPDGNEMWGKWTYREVSPPERLVFIVAFSDPDGGTTRHPNAPEWPLETLSTVTFDEQDGRTTVTVRWAAFNATEAEHKTFSDGRDGMRQGWTSTFEQLQEYLAQQG